MENLLTIEEINHELSSSQAVLLYFYGNSCGVCSVIKEKLEIEMTKYPNIKSYKIFTESNMEAFAEFNIFTLPVVLFYIDGKEYIREARNISVRDLLIDIDRLYELYFN
ncbi:MAG: thioredoxin family protein [Clostridium sp.]